MTTSEIPHLWANQSRPRAKSAGVSFDGMRLFSYSTEIARLVTIEGETIAIHNPRSYSRTTGKHQSRARGATCHLTSYRLDPSLVHLVTSREGLKLALAKQIELDATNAENEKVWKRENAKAKRELKRDALKSATERADEWRRGLRHSIPYGDSVALRLVGDTVETSKGARVPAKVASRLWKAIAAGVAFDRPDFNFGDYKGAKFDGETLVVGCHKIAKAELEIIAHAMGLLETITV